MRKAIIVGPHVGSVLELDQTLLSAQIHPRELERTLKIGVDGGVQVLAKAGWKPNFAVGDWDSLKTRAALKGIMHLTLPKNKDRSDLYFAARAAVSVGVTDLVCVGVSGGRPDHHLAMIFDLSELGETYPQLGSITVLDPGAKYHFLSHYQRPWRAKLPSGPSGGATVSIFALGEGAKGVTLTGFQYPLKNATLLPSSWGLSNRVAKAKNNAVVNCSASIKKGRAVVIELMKPYPESQ